MRYDYYERLVEYERRRMEHARLYTALAETAEPSLFWHNLRVAAGHRLIRAGAWLAGEPSAQLVTNRPCC